VEIGFLDGDDVFLEFGKDVFAQVEVCVVVDEAALVVEEIGVFDVLGYLFEGVHQLGYQSVVLDHATIIYYSLTLFFILGAVVEIIGGDIFFK
jgi:ABC-type microcin C transport system permease subunit YejB